MTLKLGYKASAEQFAPRKLLDFSVAAEQAGFDSVFVSDHFQPWRHTDGHAPSALAWLGALGASTHRIIMGTSVLTPTFRYHPSVVAQVFGTLGSLFPGRVILGVGTGEGLNEVPSTGMVWPEMKERFARLREAISLIRKLWSEDELTFPGEYYKTQNATIYDKPGAYLPIYVAGAGPQVAKYAGRMADGFICTSGKKWDLYTETLLPNVAEGLSLASKPKPDFDRMIEMKVSFDTDKRRAMEEKVTVHNPKEMERLSDALPVERAASRWIVSSDPDEHIEKIKPYIDIGFRHLVFHAPGDDQARFIKLYGEMVLPKLRARFG
jgi:coenzyme F420-dependent glucose-6-phosphate dehydrogenase